MKKELTEKKPYIAPMLQIITVDCHDIIAQSPGSGNGNSSDDEGDGLGDDYWHEGLI